jgi:cysteine desulfurase/selenocysteine lyase
MAVSSSAPPLAVTFDPRAVKRDFPIFDGSEARRRLVFLDSAASSQKPRAVLEAMERYYETTHANVHRGVYAIAEEATAEFEAARAAVSRFIGAPSPRGVIFTKNATEAINLVAHSWGRTNLKPGDVVLLSEVEHHANLVPWLILQEERGIELRFLGLGDDGYLILDDLERQMEGATKLKTSEFGAAIVENMG